VPGGAIVQRKAFFVANIFVTSVTGSVAGVAVE
jgi:hypothetical protein